MSEVRTVSSEVELAEFISQFYDDPLGFVMAAYPWDTDPSIQMVKLPEPWRSERFPNCEYGPDVWACKMLDAIGEEVRKRGFDGRTAVEAIRVAVKSGHGTGKSAMTAWLCDWLMSTRPFCMGTVTANTSTQLETRTWARISSWTKKCITSHWFNVKTGRGSMRMECIESKEDWFIAAQTCRKENAEAFAGQHAANSTSFYIFDEGSAIENIIYEVAEGGLTDGEPMIFVFGNPTRNSGKFFDCWHKDRNAWITFTIDSRDVQITNKKNIQDWLERYGEDSDFFKVRVKGDFPAASVKQFIPSTAVEDAMRREPPPASLRSSVAIIGVDFARYGDDETVIATRFGRDATLPLLRFQKLSGAESAREVMRQRNELMRMGFNRIVIFGDAGGVGGPILDMLRDVYHVPGVIDVHFGAKPDNKKEYGMKRDEMWGRMRDWVATGGGCLPHDTQLKDDMTMPEYWIDQDGRYRLESKDDMKKRGLHSPDSADALALTFAEEVNDSMLESQDPEFYDTVAVTDFNPFA